MKKREHNMLQGPLFLNIILYTVPIILTSLLQLLFNAADLVIVGRYCGSVSLAAVGATGSVTNLLVNFFVGCSVGSGVSVAHALGEQNDQAVRRTVHVSLPIALIFGTFLTVVGVLVAEPVLRLMGTPENVLPLSAEYMRIYFCGVVFVLVYNFCAAILRAAGDTKSPLIFLTFSGVLNVGLNVVFVTILDMNVAGVAWATVISQAVSAVLVVFTLMRRQDACKLMLKELRFYRAELLKIFRIGLPAGLQSTLFAISNVLIQSSINSFGDALMSGNAAAGNIEGFVYMAMYAFSQTAVNYVGQNTGARQYDRIKRIAWICLASVSVVGLVGGLSGYHFGPKLLSIYITDSPEAIACGMIRLSMVCAPYFMCGLMDTTCGLIRGLGSSVTPMAITVLGICGFRIGWIMTVFQIPAYHTPRSLYFSYILSWTLTFIVEFVVFWCLLRKKEREFLQEQRVDA